MDSKLFGSMIVTFPDSLSEVVSDLFLADPHQNCLLPSNSVVRLQ